ncbi:hypothetical protein [Frigoribacterium sp. CFBP9030]|uniref:hypothetical protein n=1 Tax=Frigoribacterium sp. CFBP9030 TaxID=3096537 RepID=UPI002A69BCCA|nr:hypothetical protein [Frigoribacterium sp. CFBP9030]MDY0891884.1 hypothetical protein [Frigoribacterium sp. CFBP9030]
MRIDDTVFWGGYGDEGFFIDAEGFEGWEDTPDARYEEIVVPGADGSYDSETELAARLLIVTGKCVTKLGPDKLGWYGRRLTGLLQGKKRVHVDYQGLQSFADGRLASAVKFRTSLPGREARFQFSLRFHNPRKFGAKVPLAVTGPGATQEIFHHGNTTAYPQLVVRGTMPGYRIEGPDSTWSIARAVTPATPHLLDTATGVLSENGNVPLASIRSGSGWGIPPGRIFNTHRLIPDSGSGTLETVLYDTYL